MQWQLFGLRTKSGRFMAMYGPKGPKRLPAQLSPAPAIRTRIVPSPGTRKLHRLDERRGTGP
ncbi:UNVERIFIED_ORG: hypothetical protein ABIB52_003145 [Arthrobacter sp. UYCu721]